MKRLLILLILFMLLVLEGVALDILPLSIIQGDYILVSHWVFVFLIFLAIFYDREDTYISVIYALVFGLIIDIVYTGVLGVYMFSYALSIYMVHGLIRILHANFFVTILLGTAGLILSEVFIHFIFSVTGIAELTWKNYMVYRLMPTVLANILFLLALYPFMVKRLIRWKEEQLTVSRQF